MGKGLKQEDEASWGGDGGVPFCPISEFSKPWRDQALAGTSTAPFGPGGGHGRLQQSVCSFLPHEQLWFSAVVELRFRDSIGLDSPSSMR